MGRGGGSSSRGGGFSSGGGRSFSSHHSSSSHRGGGSSFGSSSFGRSSGGSSMYRRSSGSSRSRTPAPRPVSRPVVITHVDNSTRDSYNSGSEQYKQPDRNEKNIQTANNHPEYRSPQRENVKEKKTGLFPAWYKHLCMFALCAVFILMFFSFSTMNAAKNSKTREKLEPGQCISIDNTVRDDLDWITDMKTVKDGMDYFYRKTGIQPYLYVTDSLDGVYGGDVTDEAAEEYLGGMYDSLFDDEGHMIFTFMEYEDSEYVTYLYAGKVADSVMDYDARETFLNNADRYYTDSSLSDEEFFAKIFYNSADSIMADHAGRAKTARMCLGLSAAIIIVMLGGFIAFKVMEEKRKHAQEIKEILEAPVGSSSLSPEEEDLLNKYQ